MPPRRSSRKRGRSTRAQEDEEEEAAAHSPPPTTAVNARTPVSDAAHSCEAGTSKEVVPTEQASTELEVGRVVDAEPEFLMQSHVVALFSVFF